VDAARIEPGMAVLDVGTGPGYAARRAAKRGAEVTGVDIADEVLARARRLHPGIRFLRGDAENLPFAEHSFDALVSNFTINHLPRPELAVREFARVLPPGGRIVLSAWDTPEHNRFLGILVDAAREAGLTAPRDAPAGPDPYRFAGDDEFRDLLADAGFDGVEVRTVALMQQVPNTNALWRGMLGGSVRTGGLVTRAAPRMRTTVREAVEQLAEEYRSAAGLAIPARAKLAWGRR
jgi:SAM-dependent methyltransferase